MSGRDERKDTEDGSESVVRDRVKIHKYCAVEQHCQVGRLVELVPQTLSEVAKDVIAETVSRASHF